MNLSPCPSPRRASSRVAASISGVASASRPWKVTCASPTYGARLAPVASLTAATSSSSENATASSPANSRTAERVASAKGSTLSAPASRASWTKRADSTSKASSSHTNAASRAASDSHRRPSPSDTSSRRKALTALLNVGVPAAYPSVISSARPSSSRSDARGGCDEGGAALAARAVSSKLSSLASMPGKNAAVSASR